MQQSTARSERALKGFCVNATLYLIVYLQTGNHPKERFVSSLTVSPYLSTLLNKYSHQTHHKWVRQKFASNF